MFSRYFDIFYNCTTFIDTMAPFVRCTYGPSWFTNEFPSNSPENAEEINQIWQAYLSPCLLPIRLSSSSNKNQLVISKYFPSYYSRQFGLCQLRPAPVCLHKEEFYTPKDERAYQQIFRKFHFKDLIFEPTNFQPRFSCTKKFQDWWSEYYTKASKGKTDAEVLKIVYSALSSQLAEKNKSPVDVPKQKVTKTAPKQKHPTARTPPKTKTTTTNTKKAETQSTPTSTKRKLRTSPISKSKPHGKQVISSDLEDTDSEDDMPLVQRSRKRPQPDFQTRAKGIIIQEPQEQTTANFQKSTDQPQSKKAKIKETQSDALTSKSAVTPIVIPETTTPELSKETDADAHSVEVLGKEIDEAEGRKEESATTPQGNFAEETASVEIETKAPENVSGTFDREAMDVGIEGRTPRSQGSDANDMSAKESTNSAMDDDELSKLKEVNPLAALKLMLSGSTSSTDMVTSGSTNSLHSINQESTTDLISQLKAKVLEGDLAMRIRQNQAECFEIKALLQKLYKSKPKSTLLAFLLEFGPFFEQFCVNVANHSNTLKQKEKIAQLYEQETNSFQTSQEKLNAIEAEDAQVKANIAEWDLKIQHYKEQIKILQTKLASAESWRQREEEKLKESLESRTKAEAVEAIKHLDNATQHQTTIAKLDEDLSYLEDAITLSSSIFDRLKISLSKL